MALLTVLSAAPPIIAGLVFVPANALPGADAAALAGSGATLWAATPRGVWRLDAGTWVLDGLSARRISSIAVADTVYAADGEKVWRRGADGTWSAETLPSGLVFPSLLATDGSAVWAAGLGVAKRSSGTWSLLANPGGLVTAAAVVSGDLVVGLRGGAAQYAGASVTLLSTGLPAASTVQALGVANGTLYAGTGQALYSFAGTWSAVTGFGVHDVRAVTGAGSTLRVATADAGVLSYIGYWLATNTGLLVTSAKSFGTLGSDLYVGTAGAPVSRLSGGSWSAAGTGLYAASISDVKNVAGSTFAAAHGAGLAAATPPGANFAPEGCADVSAIAGNSLSLFAATNCHLYAWALGPGLSSPPAIVEAGLPLGVSITSLAAVTGGSMAGGTSNAGMWRLVASTWSSDNAGLPANGAVQTTREVAGKLYASVGGNLFVRAQSAWQALSGAPAGVQALAGDSSVLFAAPVSGGIFSSTSSWREDDFGASTAFVSSLDVGGGTAFAAGGTAGVLRRTGGGWQPEHAGLPPGADVRVVLRGADGSQLFAGTAGSGLYLAPTFSSVKYLPVILDVVGATGARFRSDLTLGNRSTSPLTVTVGFVPAPDFGLPTGGSGSITVELSPSSELRAPDALQFFHDHGLAIAPGPSGTAGSVWIAADPQTLPAAATDYVYAFSRAYTVGAAGSFGTFLDAPSDLEAAEDEGAVFGLRSISGTSRSNLAVGVLPGRASGEVTLSIQVYDQSGAAAGAAQVTSLKPGEWRQFNGILGLAGLPDGSYGYAKITRTSGGGAWTAYGVVNDARTSDGSILPLYQSGGLAAGRQLLVPVVLDVFGAAGSHYTTELTVANDGDFSTPVDLVYRPAPNFGSSTGVPVVTFTLAAHQQTTIPDILAYLRSKGVNIPAASTGPQAGSLSVAFRNLGTLDSPKTVALARTTTPNPDTATGGAFGVAYPAAVKGGGARTSALVPGLASNASVRSNLAVVHLGGGSEIPLSLSVRLYDATTSQAVGNVVTVALQPGDWIQWSSIFEVAGVPAGTTAACAVITRLAGDDTWLAYGVLNDAKTSDGSILRMLPSTDY
ncbi:MAG TPA: hypothetical protein VKS23_09035 [Thermoanaerobaculia bacterium]|nr:hypothetical protein [Thermoanaerobaculia bacterium]